MASEGRTLPPEPWRKEHGDDGWIRLFDANNMLIARIDDEQPAAVAVAEMFCRAPALESEVARLTAELGEMQVRAQRWADRGFDATQKRDAKAALLRELAAAIRVLDGEVPHTTGWKRARETMLGLLRRAEAEAGKGTIHAETD